MKVSDFVSRIFCQACKKYLEQDEVPNECPHCGVNALIIVHEVKGD